MIHILTVPHLLVFLAVLERLLLFLILRHLNDLSGRRGNLFTVHFELALSPQGLILPIIVVILWAGVVISSCYGNHHDKN